MHKSVFAHAMRSTTTWGVAFALAAAVALPGCTSTPAGDSSSYLIIDSLRAAAGASTTFGDSLASDVLTKNVIWTDNGQVTLRLALKDPGTPVNPSTPSSANFVTLSRYEVRYTSTTAGVPVPAPFEGAVTATVGSAGSSTTVSFNLVRAEAKAGAPLIGLRNPSGEFISTIAEVTFFGKDQTGRDVVVKGTISVIFADWADPA